MADLTLNIRHNANEAAPAVRRLSDEMGGFAKNSSNAAKSGSAAAAGFSKIGKTCLNAGKSASVGATGIGKFVSSLKRIAFYRAIRTAIRYITQAFNEGLQAAYNFSKLGGESAKLASAMDNLKEAGGRMKLQLGAAFGGLITAIEPILIRIINLVTAAADAITRFFAVLNGAGFYKKAVGGIDDIGKSAGGASKKIKGLLASWDELTVIGNESGGGGGGGSSADYSGMYEWAAAESVWADLFNQGDFFKIGQKITEMLHDISQKFSGWIDDLKKLELGKKFAAFLNGIFSDPAKWSDIGESIGKFLGWISSELVKFFRDFDFPAFFKSVASFFVGFAEGFFKEMKDVFPEGSFWDNVFEGGNMLFSSIDKLLTNNLELQRFKTTWQMLWSDVKIAALEAWVSILETLDNPIADKLFGTSDALAKNKEKLAEAKEEAANLDLKYKDLTKTIEENKTKTDELSESVDNLNGKKANVEVNVNVNNPIETNDLFGDRPIGHGKVVGEGTAILEIDVHPLVGTPIEDNNIFGTNSGVTSANGRTTLALGVLPELRKPLTFDTDIEDLTATKTLKVKPELTTNNLSVTISADTTALKNAMKNALTTTVKVTYKNSSGETKPAGQINSVAYAQGGFPEEGQVFLAREAGPELVGTIGNRTAVANNDQIVAAIASGLKDSQAEQNELLRTQNNILTKLLQKDLTITPSVGLGQVVARSTALYGRAV